MIENFLEIAKDYFNIFDAVVFIIFIYCVIQCTGKGFTLSFFSFMKWVGALIITFIIHPKLQPWVSDYINSPFINGIGLGIIIYFTALFILILFGKFLNNSMKWTGFGSMDKTFGFFFGIFKGYVVSVCLFALLNWFYPLNKWGIEVDKSFTFSFLKNSSDVLIDEFPEYQEFENTKDKIEKI